MRLNIHTCCPALLSCWKLLILTRPLLAPEQPCNGNWDFIVLIQVRNKLQWMKIFIQRVLTETQTIKMKNNVYKIGLIILQISLLWQKAKMIWFSFDLGRFQLHPMLFNNEGKLARVYPFYTVCHIQEEPLFLVKDGSSISMWSVADGPFTWWPVIVSQSVHWKLSTESEWWWSGCPDLPFVLFLALWSMLSCKL